MMLASRAWDKLEERSARRAEVQRQIALELEQSLTPIERSPSLEASHRLLPENINNFRTEPASNHRTNIHLEALGKRIEEQKRQQQLEEITKKASPTKPTSTHSTEKKSPSSSHDDTTPSSGTLDSCLARLNEREARSKEVQQFEKTIKLIKCTKLHITMLTNTRRDIKFRLDGTPSDPGPRALIDLVAQKAPKQLDACMQVIADRIVQCASANLAVDALMRGEANYGLAYLTLILCEHRPAFTNIILGALEAACPYIRVGLRDHWEQEAQSTGWSKDMRKRKLGYKDESESDNDYIFRMQTLVAFYAAILQTSPKLLESYMKMVGEHQSTVTNNPFGGLSEAWRWLARTINGTKWRWTRFLIQAFLCIAGRDLSVALPKQMLKLMKVMSGKTFKTSCEQSASHPNDDDRIRSFENFVAESIQLLETEGSMKPPGRYDEIDGQSVFVDPRNLPDGAIRNTG